MSIKNLFVILKNQDINLNIKLHEDEENDLVTFTHLEKIKVNFKDYFRNIYDLSNLKKDEIINILLTVILDFKLIIKGNTHVNYDYIYLYNNDRFEKYKVNTIKNYGKDLFFENIFYNQGNIIKNYCGYEGSSRIAIEHGMYWGNVVPDNELSNKYPAIITFGDYREECIRKKTDKDIIKIGPYINYAEILYPDSLMRYIKDIMGKTLLVFPVHSTSSINVQYDVEQFIDYIKEFSNENKFQSVIICMFSKDIQNKMDLCYKKSGFTVVTCGDRLDLNFLNKQKSIMALADYVLTNKLGTYFGYSIFLDKPCTFFNQEVIETIVRSKLDEDTLKDISRTYSIQKYDFEKEFKDFNEQITKSQYELCNLYWGFEYIKTKDEMKLILDLYNK